MRSNLDMLLQDGFLVRYLHNDAVVNARYRNMKAFWIRTERPSTRCLLPMDYVSLRLIFSVLYGHWLKDV